MLPSIAVIRSASLNGYAELANSLGLNYVSMMQKVGLSVRCLENPETPISVKAVSDLLEASSMAANAEDFGLQLARGRRLADLGAISIVMREEPTARNALDTLMRYLRLLNASLITHIEEQKDTLLIREDLLLPRSVPVRQSMELAVGVMYQILHELLGPEWRPRKVCFSHRPPKNMRTHRGFFGSNIEFNCSLNGIICDASDLSKPLPISQTGMGAFARRFLDQALTNNRAKTYDAVRQLVAAMLPSGRCTADQVAQHLGIERRTLYRHLQSDGVCFSDLMQEVRSDLALRQISESDRSMSEYAELLGFSGASSFAYWFRIRFGCTVSAWRTQAKHDKTS